MGDSSVEVSEENMDAAQEAKGKAMEAISEGIYFVNFLVGVFMHSVIGCANGCRNFRAVLHLLFMIT